MALCVNALLVTLVHHLKATNVEKPDKYRIRKVNFERPQPRVIQPPKPKPKKKKKPKKKPKPKVIRKQTVTKPPPVHPLNMQTPPLKIDMRLRSLDNLHAIIPPPPPEPEPEVIEEPVEEEPGIYDVAVVDKAPKPILRNPPVYPSSAKRLGLEGWVDIEFVVDELGAIATVDVVDSSSRRFHDSAISAVYGWRFEPAVKDQHVVAVLCRQKLKFSLRN